MAPVLSRSFPNWVQTEWVTERRRTRPVTGDVESRTPGRILIMASLERSSCLIRQLESLNGSETRGSLTRRIMMRFYNDQHRHYCGVDLHTKRMYLCILDQEGNKL